jgi:hypothetical protein
MITSGKIYVTGSKCCGNCRYVAEYIMSNGRGAPQFHCTGIRGKERDEYGHYIEEAMRVSKYKKACNFYKQGL